ncbi:FecCD family ABC transporter permease [Curtanaerobium respiraculi]|uniref:FecCD family ABC transporter permease n=1 Tax=Curtanaerobium respiraculi TaxID=2949669 RepID=UPI0024B3C1B0|nr:iron ABC transporter permease [Curtanaerobium respiraculi]
MNEDRVTGGAPKPPVDIGRSYAAYARHKVAVLIGLCVAVAALAVATLGMGSYDLSLPDIVKGLLQQADSRTNAIIWNMRLPRVLTALVAGASLSLAGCAYQSLLRNPLASASTLGISQGAAFGASLAIIVLGGGGAAAAFEGVNSGDPALTVLCAFVGAMLSTMVILGLSRLREMTPESIVLLGVALSALFTAGTTFIQYFAEDTQVAAVVFWTFGDLSRVNMSQLAIMVAVMVAVAVFCHLNRWKFNAIESGEGLAHGLGVAVTSTRLAGMVVASAAAASVIAFCGIVNFVGLVAPHIMRRVLGADYRYLLPSSAVCGAGLVLLADILCRTIVAPLILPISAVTSLVGAPLFIYLLFRGVQR